MKVLSAEIVAMLARWVRHTARRQMRSALLIGLALLFAGVAIVASIAAIGVALASRWGVLAACLIIAASAIVLAIGLVVVVAQQAKVARRSQRAALDPWQHAVLAAGAISPDLTTGRALLIAMALGLLVGLTGARKPQDRQ